MSGGPPYAIALPDSAADPPVAEEWHATTFVEYLRAAFRWGGFPGFERTRRRREADLRYLTEGLLPC